MTPMFSAYVVVPEPPNMPDSVVATPSPMNERPISGSRSSSVIVATAFTCPAFSASSTSSTAGTISTIARPLNSGVTKSGNPNQSAAWTASQLTLPSSAAKT